MGTGLRIVCGFGLFCGGFLSESLRDPAADLVSALFDGGEIEVVDFFVGSEDIP